MFGKAATGAPLSTNDMKLSLAAVKTKLAYLSWQRPGAVTNATLQEFTTANQVSDDADEPYWVMRVARHKTAREGPANITLTKPDHTLVGKYIKYVRPLCNPTSEYIFTGLQGQPITDLNRYIQWLGAQYNISTPTCTTLLKVAATEAALKCDDPTRKRITSQMSHSEPVHTKHYEKLTGAKEAAKAHQVRQKLALAYKSMTYITLTVTPTNHHDPHQP